MNEISEDEYEALAAVQYAAGEKLAAIRCLDFKAPDVQDAICSQVVAKTLPGDTTHALVARCLAKRLTGR